MTLHATRNGKQITVHTTHGPVDNHVTEHWQHVKGFRDQLNHLLDQAEAEEKRDHEAGQRERA